MKPCILSFKYQLIYKATVIQTKHIFITNQNKFIDLQ